MEDKLNRFLEYYHAAGICPTACAILRFMSDNKACDFCEVPCNNDHCSVKPEEDKDE